MQSPFPMISPELLAQIAQGAFRPPQGMGMQAPSMPQTPGFNMGDGMMGLGMGLAAFRPMGDVFMGSERTAGDADLGGYGGFPADPMSGNPNAQPVEVFNPTGAASGGPVAWVRRQLGLF